MARRLRAESFCEVAAEIENLDSIPGVGPLVAPAYGRRALHEQSHGESFFAPIQHRFRGPQGAVTNEPTFPVPCS
jgi:predicted ATPase